MATAANEICIEWLGESYYLMGEGIALLIVEEVNLLRGIFLMEEMSKLLPVWWDSFPFQGFSINV